MLINERDLAENIMDLLKLWEVICIFKTIFKRSVHPNPKLIFSHKPAIVSSRTDSCVFWFSSLQYLKYMLTNVQTNDRDRKSKIG